MIWPWQTRERLIESNEWLTDVIPSQNGEQRFSMRQIPRTLFNFDHTFNEQEYQAARAIIRQDPTLQVPDWTLSVNVGTVNSGSSVSVNYGEPYSGLTDGDTAILWESQTKYEAVTIESADSADAFILETVAANYEKAKLMPLRNAQAPDGLEGTRKAGKYINTSIAFHLTDSEDIGQSPYALYQGDDLVADCPVIASETFDEPILWPADAIDAGVPYPTLLNQRNVFDSKYVMRWHVFNRSDLYTLRRFIHSRRGKWKSFWLPSFKADFILVNAIGAADNSIVVYAPDEISDLGYTSFDIEIAGAYYRRVTSYTAATGADGLTHLTLNIDSVTGAALASDVRVSYLRHLRFDADRIEFNHLANSGVVAVVPCKELPQ